MGLPVVFNYDIQKTYQLDGILYFYKYRLILIHKNSEKWMNFFKGWISLASCGPIIIIDIITNL